jgi:IS5 family transposase
MIVMKSQGVIKKLRRNMKRRNTKKYMLKGYQSANNNDLLENRVLKNRIMKKAYRNQKLTKWEIVNNKLIGKIRFKIEKAFGNIKRWFNGKRARYKGNARAHGQNVMEAVGYDLYQSPGIVISNSKKKA